MTFAVRGNAKPLGKRLSPSAEMPNHSGNDFRHARKCQTTRETTFAMRGNAKPFGKRLSPCAEMPNPSENDFRRARKCQTFRETTFAVRGKLLFGLSAVCRSVVFMFRRPTTGFFPAFSRLTKNLFYELSVIS